MAYCQVPYHSKQQDMHFPCGKCPACLQRRVSEWTFRLQQQDKVSDEAWFITLTYNTSHVPISKNGFKTLDYSDLQKFFKRLRKIEPRSVKYYACGEYGSKRMRPHYHAIIFNASPSNVIDAWYLDGRSIGEVYFGSVTGASIAYVLKYMSKEPLIGKFKNDDRVKEKALMSKGLGLSYITPATIRYHLASPDRYSHVVDGVRVPMSRLFKQKILGDLQATYAQEARNKALQEQERQYAAAIRQYGELNYLHMLQQHKLMSFKKIYSNSKKRSHD